MPSSRTTALALICILLLAPHPGVAEQQDPALPDDVDVDGTTTRIELRANGTAEWSIEIRTRLADDAALEEYRAFQDRFRENRSTYRAEFTERMRGVADTAATATDREMAVTNVSVATDVQEVPRRWGVVTYSFTWHGFARADGDAVRVGDVFQGGFYLADGDVLEIAAPPGHRVDGVSPKPASSDESTVRWVGPVDFADGRPNVTAGPARQSATPGADDATQSAGPRAIGVALFVVLVGVVALWRRRGWTVSGPSAASDDDAAEDTPGVGDDSGVPPGELTDAEAVTALLEESGERMRQADIAESLDWSASKVSRVLSAMAADGEVEKLRVGRENLIALADEADE